MKLRKEFQKKAFAHFSSTSFGCRWGDEKRKFGSFFYSRSHRLWVACIIFNFIVFTESIKNCTACCHVCFTYIELQSAHKKQKQKKEATLWHGYTIRNLFSLLDISLLIISFHWQNNENSQTHTHTHINQNWKQSTEDMNMWLEQKLHD